MATNGRAPSERQRAVVRAAIEHEARAVSRRAGAALARMKGRMLEEKMWMLEAEREATIARKLRSVVPLVDDAPKA